MSGYDNFCLRSIDFEKNTKTSWQELQMEKFFCDVTLACEDKQIKTHKLVISSCSPVLRNILMTNQTPHSLIYLRKVKYRDLQNLLNFMYQGEVNVSEEDLPSFLELSEDLHVRGLSEENTKTLDTSENFVSQFSLQNDVPSLKRKTIVDSEKVDIDKHDYSVSSFTKFGKNYDNFSDQENIMFAPKEIKSDVIKHLSSAENKEQNVISTSSNNKLINYIEGSHACGQCDYKTKKINHLKQHVKSIHEDERYPCDQCNVNFTDKSSLRRHIKSTHEGNSYPCDQCNYNAARKDSLRKHQLNKHI